jgi:hypothetical protein
MIEVSKSRSEFEASKNCESLTIHIREEGEVHGEEKYGDQLNNKG